MISPALHLIPELVVKNIITVSEARATLKATGFVLNDRERK